MLEKTGYIEQAALLHDRLADRSKDSDTIETSRTKARRLWTRLATLELERGVPDRAFPILKRMIKDVDNIRNQDEVRLLGKKMILCTAALLRAAVGRPSDPDWEMARQGLEMVSQTFAEDLDGVALVQRSNWFLVGLVRVRKPELIVNFRLGDQETRYLISDKSVQIIVAEFLFAHAGNTRKSLSKQAISWKSTVSEPIEFLGFESKDGILATIEFSDNKLGPETIIVPTVWRVPATVHNFIVSAYGSDAYVNLVL
ncbi:MAG: hypothetical protein JXA30_00790 [Deltaproteobacteria bacterium]|nr:hypothetical protein [Deltaproteobacteria bacterium]